MLLLANFIDGKFAPPKSGQYFSGNFVGRTSLPQKMCLVKPEASSVPLAWSWRLANATAAQRGRFEILGSGEGVHWPDLDEDISARGMLQGIPACPPKPAKAKRRRA